MSAYLVDTDIFIDFFRGKSAAQTFIRKYMDVVMISSITAAELFAGVKGEREKNAVEDFISLFPIIPVTAVIAKKGGLYKQKYGKSHGIGLADAIIAATADAENAELKTLNIKHFPMFENITSVY